MAAATENSREEFVAGNRVQVVANLTFANNGDTYDTGLSSVDGFQFTPTTAAAAGMTESSGTVTLVAGAGLSGQLVAWGTGN